MPITIPFPTMWLHNIPKAYFESVHVFTLFHSDISSSQYKVINSAFCSDVLKR